MLRSLVLLVLTVGSPELTGLAPQLPGPVRTETPLPPGTGATLVIGAPERLCRADVELLVARTVFAGRNYVFQTPVTPPACEWVIEDVRPGDYQAVLQMARGDRRVVAMSSLEVFAGSTWKLLIAPLAATVEGLITVEGVPVAGAHVEVKQNRAPGWSWEARTDSSGHYSVTLMPLEHMCVRVTLPDAINPLSAGRCQDIGNGTNRQDLDIPGGRIEVTMVPREGPILDTPVLLGLTRPESSISVGVTVTARGDVPRAVEIQRRLS